MAKQNKSVEQLRTERQQAVSAGDQARVAELDQQLNAQPGGQSGGQTNTGESGTAQA